MKNEKITEGLVRDELTRLGYRTDPSLTLDEQRSTNFRVRDALSNASKTGNGGPGAPEFIVTSTDNTDYILVIECKADIKDHGANVPKGNSTRNIKRYAVSGVLHYAAALSVQYNVIAVAVSGMILEGAKISSFLHRKGSNIVEPLRDKRTTSETSIARFLSWKEYVEVAKSDSSKRDAEREKLTKAAKDIHMHMYKYAKLSEGQKPLLVAGTLLALEHTPFRETYMSPDIKSEDLPGEWLSAIGKSLKRERNGIRQFGDEKRGLVMREYESLSYHPELIEKVSGGKEEGKGVLFSLIEMIHKDVYPFTRPECDIDAIGEFYKTFLSYAAGDQKGLGIVLTPHHITELFSLLAEITPSSKVLDPCTGTGGFLVSAMHRMFYLVDNDARKSNEEKEFLKDRIKSEGLVGDENSPAMFTLGVSNMVIRGDGKANMYQGSCFRPDIKDDLREHKCDIGMINPPYAQGGEHSELHFIDNLLDLLVPGGKGIAIVPVSSTTVNPTKRETILSKHTLEAVMNMPEDLFDGVGTMTCIMMFTAHQPHAANKETWFADWRDDGFENVHHVGRRDAKKRWAEIRDEWISSFKNRRVEPGRSVMKHVDATMEWRYEAYVETDYSELTREMFEEVLRARFLYNMTGGTKDLSPEDVLGLVCSSAKEEITCENRASE